MGQKHKGQGTIYTFVFTRNPGKDITVLKVFLIYKIYQKKPDGDSKNFLYVVCFYDERVL